jgi:hypothetical protein
MMEEDTGENLEVAVHEQNLGCMACCRNSFEADHILAEFGEEMIYSPYYIT